MSRSVKTVLHIACDLGLIVVAGFLSILVRFEFTLPEQYLLIFIRKLPILASIRLICYYIFGMYNQLWRYASVNELVTIVEAGSVASLFDWLFLHYFQRAGFPRSVTLLMWIFNIAFAGGLRLVIRYYRELLSRKDLWQGRGGVWARGPKGSPTLIIGAGEAGNMVAREIRSHGELPYRPVGFIDDDPAKVGYRVAGLPVLGSRKDLPQIVRRHSIKQVIIAMPSAPGTVVREIVDLCKGLDVSLKTLPGVYELIDGRVSVRFIRDVQIEDLLRREQVKVDLESIAGYLGGKRVLITGAGGSIGSELSRQVARFKPAELLLLGHGENSIYEIEMELRANRPDLELVPIIADIRDQNKIDRVFERFRPEVVFHAAAHKHVPLMEANPDEAITNNIFGTWNVASAADRYGAERFVLISTDKAVNPTSVMGSSKRAAEILIQTLNWRSKTKFVAVRFGNVLGSRGSVIPLFTKQIARGGPVTVTHPEMRRYFMTIPEAVQLVIQAAALGEGGEIFVLDMGKPIRILDMARDLIRLSWLEPDKDIKIEFTGIRPGEKLFEDLFTNDEKLLVTKHERIFVAKDSSAFDGDLEEFFQTCRELAAAGEKGGNAFVNWIKGLSNSNARQEN